MESFKERMLEEHAQLVEKINKLHAYVYSELSEKDDKVEFANKCLQLKGMKIYEEALRARLFNLGVFEEKECEEAVKQHEYKHKECGKDNKENTKENTKEVVINIDIEDDEDIFATMLNILKKIKEEINNDGCNNETHC